MVALEYDEFFFTITHVKVVVNPYLVIFTQFISVAYK